MLPDVPAISCRGVTRTYGGAGGSVEALHALEARFPAGELTVVVGPSGCGKSTLLRLLAGIDLPDEGVIEVGRVEITALAPRDLRRYRRDAAAFIAQRASANLVPHLTVEEQLGDADGRTLVRELALDGRADARADQLSGGEQSRAALAVGLSRGTPLVLIDEPTAELDRATAQRVIGLISRLTSAGRTVVAATHDPDLVRIASVRLDLTRRLPHEDPAAASARSASRGPAVLVLRGLTKSYSGRRVVDDASLALKPGELGVLLGRSGSGKSTLLMMAGGWISADTGSVDAPTGRPGRPPAWTEISYLPQRFGLLPELSVAENMALPLRLGGRAGTRPDDGLVDGLGLGELLERAPYETSLGQQQRIALARALAVRPRVMLADEPTSHQDAGSAEQVWRALRVACEAGTACLVATHDERLAALADRFWSIEDGRVRPG